MRIGIITRDQRQHTYRALAALAAAAALAYAMTANAADRPGTITNATLDREANVYDARLNTIHIGTQPINTPDGQPIPELSNGPVTINQWTDEGFGVFTQCTPTCTEWDFWELGPDHHIFIPIVITP